MTDVMRFFWRRAYAAVRNPEAVTLMGVVPLKLDVTSDEDVVARRV